MTDLAALSARALARAIREKKVSSVEATTAAIKRLKDCHELTNCIVTLEADEALAAAKAADAAVAKGSAGGALAGVPLAHKDMFDRKGKIASWGAKIRADRAGAPRTPPPSPASRPRARCRSRRCISPSSPTARRGTTTPRPRPQSLGHHAHHRRLLRRNGRRVAYGAIPVGLGSDTGGSLRLPAACCGIASIKPTWGRISRAGAMPLSPALDTVGVLARHVEDLALALGVLAGPDARDPAAIALPVPDYVSHLDDPVQGLKVGVDEAVIGEATPRCSACCRRCWPCWRSWASPEASCRFPDWQTLDHLVQLVQLPDASAAHTAYLRTRPRRLRPAGARRASRSATSSAPSTT